MASSAKCEWDWRTDISCETRLKTVKFTYTWTIHSFSMRREVTGQRIESATFSTAAPGDMKWCLDLYPNGQNEEIKGYLSLYVRCVSSYYNPVPVEYEFAVLDEGGKKFSVKKDASPFSTGCSRGFTRFIERDCLLKGTDRLLPNDKLTVYCEGLAFVGSGSISSPNRSVAVTVPDCDLSQNLGHLLASRRLSDVTFTVEGKEIQAHKVILAARSPVFAAMFEHEMKEGKKSRVEITDLKFEVLHEVVEYMYTGRAPKLNEMADEVLVAANKYDLGRLKVMCEGVLCSKLSVGTAAEVLSLADMHNADQLKANALRFIKAHGAGVVETDGWKMIASEKPYLAAEAFSALVSKTLLPREALEARENSAQKELIIPWCYD